MSRKMTSKCDGCGVEIVEMDDLTPMGVINARRAHSTEHWGSLRVSTEHFPVSFDLCDGCTKRVIDLLELQLPKPDEMLKRIGGLGGLGELGGHAMPYISPLDFGPGSRMAPPWTPPTKIGESPYGALTPEDLKHLGIELPPGLTQDPHVPPITIVPAPPSPLEATACANCRTFLAAPGVCPSCGHIN